MSSSQAERREHWQGVWESRDPEQVTWFQDSPDRSLSLVAAVEPAPGGSIIDVGGGASRLVDRLLDAGYTDVTVLDISERSLEAAQARVGARASAVHWICADVLEHQLDRRYRVWHDRAVFHFCTEAEDQRRYVDALSGAVEPGGHVVISTFGPAAPEYCSGLPVQRYDAAALDARLGKGFDLLGSELEQHRTPTGGEQQFLYASFRRRADG